MALQLNEPVVGYKAFPEEGTGRDIDQMPLLLAEGREPLGFAGLMRRRLEVLSASEAVKSDWWNNWFDSADFCVVNTDGKVKVVLDSPDFRIVTPKTILQNGGLPVDYASTAGDEFTPTQVKKYTGNDLSKRKAKTNPFWRSLARGDQGLLNEYADAAFAMGKQRWGYDEMMGVYVPEAAANTALGRPWVLYGGSGSRADGCGYYYGGRLVGVAPEAQLVGAARSAAAPLEKRVALPEPAGKQTLGGVEYVLVRADAYQKLR